MRKSLLPALGLAALLPAGSYMAAQPTPQSPNAIVQRDVGEEDGTNLPATMSSAMAKVKDIRDRTLAIHNPPGEFYPIELLEDVTGLYRTNARDPMVFHYYREQSLALLRDMFDLNIESREDSEKVSISNEDRVRMYLRPEGAELLCKQLTEFLGSKDFLGSKEFLASKESQEIIFDAELWEQRRRLLYIAKNILTSENTKALDILNRHAEDPNISPDEHRDIKIAIAQIKRGRK